MILTVTINPLLERRLIFKNISFNTENRNGKELLIAGGKGINVSRQLNFLNTKNFAFSFLGGNNGKILKDILNGENIKFTAVRTKDETRYSVAVIDELQKKVTTFFKKNSKITLEEADEFKLKLEKMIENCGIVIFSGSSPCKETDSVFPFGIKTANKYDKISLCDTYGSHLQKCVEASPTIIHNNISEIEKSLGISLKSEEEKINYLNHLYSRGIKQAFLTDGGNSFYASNFDYHYKIDVPEIETLDATGSGDSFTAGIVYGWHNDLTFEQTLTAAVSLGTLNAGSFNVCSVTPDEINLIKKRVKIFSVGKKIKKINVTPD